MSNWRNPSPDEGKENWCKECGFTSFPHLCPVKYSQEDIEMLNEHRKKQGVVPIIGGEIK